MRAAVVFPSFSGFLHLDVMAENEIVREDFSPLLSLKKSMPISKVGLGGLSAL